MIPLTPREQEVLKLIWDNLGSKAIAHQLGITKKGVDYHRHNLFRKTGATSELSLCRIVLVKPVLREATRLLQRVRNGSPVDLVEVEQWLKEHGIANDEATS